mmetsp:Transcript_25439/g.73382  ORF Transcript_25439/g.73382 Transcript_25439/m.73382 type:complete len:557 (+) Transcript_25439:136-1806(+)
MASGGYPAAAANGSREDEKHFKSHERATRFDPGQKFGCLQGRTATGRSSALWGRQTWRRRPGCEAREMEVERPETEEGLGLSALDLNQLGRPELLTSIPVQQGLAQELCEELERLCVASSLHRHPENPDFALRVFELPVVGFRRGGELARPDARLPLCSPPARQEPGVAPPTFVALAACPPEDVLEPSLMRRARLSWSGCADLPLRKSDRSGGVRPRYASIRYPTRQQLLHSDARLDCWIQDAPGSWLEVDLGAVCSVTHVSTAGRFPPTARYPSPELRQRWAKEAGEHHASFDQAWAVVKPGAAGWEQWVTKYELQARLDDGGTWTRIGDLQGNADMTTEVAHDMHEVCHSCDGLQCRFLRFLPLACHRKPAMRISVYGLGAKGPSEASKKEEERVRYRIPVPLTNRNQRRHQRDFVNRRNYSPEWYGKYGEDYEAGVRRRKLAKQTQAEADEALGRGRRVLVRRQSSPLYDSDAAEMEEEGAVPDGQGSGEPGAKGAAPEPGELPEQQPPLQRAVSRRVEEALEDRPQLQRTRTDDERGYASEPEELLADWTVL